MLKINNIKLNKTNIIISNNFKVVKGVFIGSGLASLFISPIFLIPFWITTYNIVKTLWMSNNKQKTH